MVDEQNSSPNLDTSAPLDFSPIPGHQSHMEAPSTSTGKVLDEAAKIATDPIGVAGDVVSAATEPIENYTEEGRQEHPILSRVGDITRGAKELLGGGQYAGKPMGTSSGVANNPVTATLSAPDTAETGAALEQKIGEYGPKIAEHIAETGRNFASGLAEEGRQMLTATHPEGSLEAGFAAIPGHETIAPPKLKDIAGPPSDAVQRSLRDRISDPETPQDTKELLQKQLDYLKKQPEAVTQMQSDVGKVREAAANARTDKSERQLSALSEGVKRYGDRFVAPKGYEEETKRLQAGETVQNILKSKSGQTNIKAGAVVNPKTQSIVEKAGGVYNGQNKDGMVEITLPAKMTDKIPGIDPRMKKYVSVTMPESHVTPDTVKNAIMRKFREMGGSDNTKVSPKGEGVLNSIMAR